MIQLLSMGFALTLIVIGAMNFDALSIGLGAALLLYVWLTRHMKYEVYSDRMVIYYGAPRRRTVALSSIKECRPVRAPLSGPSVLIMLQPRGVLVIQPKDPQGFIEALVKTGGVTPALPTQDNQEGPKKLESPDSQRRKPRSRPMRSKDKDQQ